MIFPSGAIDTQGLGANGGAAAGAREQRNLDEQRRSPDRAGAQKIPAGRAHREPPPAASRGGVDGPADPRVGAAPADVLGKRGVDVGVGGAGLLAKKRGRRHDHPGLAVAALSDVLGEPRALAGMPAVRGEALDRRDAAAGAAAAETGTWQERAARAVQVDGAGSADPDAAAVLGARQAQPVAQHPQEGRLRIGGLDALGPCR